MNKDYRSLARHYNWWPDTKNSVSKIESIWKSWVTDKGSLTAALVKLSKDNFRVNVLQQRLAIPYFHEQKKQGKALHHAAMIREVELEIHGTPVVYARSIVPLSLVTNGKNGLVNLGRTPLGHLLFKNGRIRVSKREITVAKFGDQSVAARRTPYDFQGDTILVSEYFLPSLKAYL